MLHGLEQSFGLLDLTCPCADERASCAPMTFSLPRKRDPGGHIPNSQAITDYLFLLG